MEGKRNMKKFVKWFLLIGILCCLAGTGIATAGVMRGGVGAIGEYVRNLEDLV